MKIDSHQHFWIYNSRDYGWMDDRTTSLQKNFLPEDLHKELMSVGVEGTVAVQARQILPETEWLLQLAEKHPFIRGVVGWVDLCSPAVEQQIESFADHPKLVGIRHVVHDELDERFLLREDFRRGIGFLKQFNLTYDILIFAKHLPVTIEFVQEFPEQKFVVDHIAKPKIKTGEIHLWAEGIRRLAQFPNVFCKLSGMVTEADWQRWEPGNFTPYLEVLLETFGPTRLMIGSDWPVCTLAASYKQVWDLVLNFINRLSKSEKRMVLAENAIKFYGLK